MALLKKIKDKGLHTLVTFTIGSEQVNGASQVSLLGDFNNWHSNDIACQMEKKGKSFTKSIKLENGKRYEFRYLSETSGWYNDSDADAYKPSPFAGVDNSVVDLTEVLPQKKKLAVKRIKKDDLKKIEGIGPKIASILIEKQIDTFEKLSVTAVSILEEILKEAGSRYKMHKPDTWPQQAKLAFENKWDELKKLQDKLDGGK